MQWQPNLPSTMAHSQGPQESEPADGVQERLIPEEAHLDYSNVYISSGSSNSSTSLDKDEAEIEHDTGEKIQYPQDLLGASWGSYLHSGPPTRAGHGAQRDVKAKLREINTMLNDADTGSTGLGQGEGVHGILRALPVKHTTQHKQGVHPAKSVKLVCEDQSKQEDSQYLLEKLQGLLKALSECKAELEKCGLETAPLASTLLSLEKFNPGQDSQGVSKQDDHGRLLSDIIEYLSKITESLAKEGRQLNEQALFLQKAGKQLGKNHMSLLEEQAILEQAIQRAQEQLRLEKVSEIGKH